MRSHLYIQHSGGGKWQVMSETNPIVFVVDDDSSVRRSTERLMRTAGLEVQCFASAREFLKNSRPERRVACSTCACQA